MTMIDEVRRLVTPPDDAEVVPTRMEFWLERRVVNSDGSAGPWRSVPPAQPHALPPVFSLAKALIEDAPWKGSHYQFRIVRYVITGVVYRDTGLPAEDEDAEPADLPDPS